MSESLLNLSEIIKLREINSRLAAVALPSELLSEIFLDCIDGGKFSSVEPRPSLATMRKDRTSITSVCYRWRQVAHVTKALWATTSFPYPFIAQQKDEPTGSYTLSSQTYDSFHHELGLSAPLPISLLSQSTTEVLAWPSFVPALKRDICEALSPILSRCHRILLEAFSDIPLAVLNAAPQRLANVTSLDIRALGEWSEDVGIEVLDLSYAKSLQSLSVEFSDRMTVGSLPTASIKLADPSQLRNLTLSGYVDGASAYDIISRASSLQSLAWSLKEGEFDESGFEFPPQQLSMPFLQHVMLGDDTPSKVLSYLDAPDIRSISLGFSYDSEPLVYMKPSSFPNLRFMSLDAAPYTESPLLPSILPEFGALEVLNLRGVMSSDLAEACAHTKKLRLVAVTWASGVAEGLSGINRLLQCWSSRVESMEIPPLSHGMCLVVHLGVAEWDRKTFDKKFVKKHPGVKLGLRGLHPFTSWQPEDWEDLFAKINANPPGAVNVSGLFLVMASEVAKPEEPIQLRRRNSQLAAVALPPELLSEIFFGCVGRAMISSTDPFSSLAVLRKNRTSITGVCYRWRQVAHATKTLWTVVGFPDPFITSQRNDVMVSYTIPPKSYESFHHGLTLAGAAPISLFSRSTVDTLAEPSLVLVLKSEICATLSPMLSRCDRIVLEAFGDIPFAVLNAGPQQLAKVRSLEVRALGEWSEGIEVENIDLSHAQSLRSLSIDISNPTPVGPIPTASLKVSDPNQLKNLAFYGSVDPESAYDVISGAKSLQSLMWLREDDETQFTVPARQLSMPLLRHLVLCHDMLVALLPHLDAPNIVSISLQVTYPEGPLHFPVPSLFPKLRFLSMDSVRYTLSPLLPSLIAQLRALEVLNIRGVMSVELAVACADAVKLRLVAVTWASMMADGSAGIDRLLQCWSSQVNSKEILPLSRGMCLVLHLGIREWEREIYTQHFMKQHPGIKFGLRALHPFTSWRPEDWDELFAKFEADSLYVPPF
ncbi:hypothetical protein DL93DRAFT_2158411 [Clavulina sp. PMI_390]|nr:hypothetical protein DL93DRAFT_2158411 [Clavulina sp. PMI_390]